MRVRVEPAMTTHEQTWGCYEIAGQARNDQARARVSRTGYSPSLRQGCSMTAGQARNDQVGHAHFQHRLKKYLTSMAVLCTMPLC